MSEPNNFDIAYSSLTDCYYVVIGKEKYDITNFVNGKIQQCRAEAYEQGREDAYEQGREDERRKFANWCDRNGIDFKSQYYPTEVVEMYEEDLANGKIKEQKND